MASGDPPLVPRLPGEATKKKRQADLKAAYYRLTRAFSLLDEALYLLEDLHHPEASNLSEPQKHIGEVAIRLRRERESD